MGITRDMSASQFQAALKRNGMESVGLGYVTVFEAPGTRTSVYAESAGTNRRAQLAYLLRRQSECAAEYEAEQKVVQP